MKPEEINPNHFRQIVIEQLQWEIRVAEESSLSDKEKHIETIIKNFLKQFKGNKLVNLNSIEEVREELKKWEKRQEAEKAHDDDER